MRTIDFDKSRKKGSKSIKFKPRVNIVPERFRSLLQLYESKRPLDAANGKVMLETCFSKKDLAAGKWYKSTGMGRGKIGKILKDGCEAAGIDIADRKIVNHSGRVTGISHLNAAGVGIVLGIEQSGHKSVEAFKGYNRTHIEQRRELADIIAPASKQGTEIRNNTNLIRVQRRISQAYTKSLISTVRAFLNLNYQRPNLLIKIQSQYLTQSLQSITISLVQQSMYSEARSILVSKRMKYQIECT
jgi:hypothetical protein